MDKILELKKKLHAFKNGIKYASIVNDVKNETLSNILDVSFNTEKKQFSLIKEDELIKKEI